MGEIIKVFDRGLNQCSVNQYLSTVKYRFILQISILYFFMGNIQISMPSIKKYILDDYD